MSILPVLGSFTTIKWMNNTPVRLSSIHTHTLFCDGKDDVETMCRVAFEKGLAAVGFSAHAPVFRKTGFKTNWHMDDEQLDKYIAEVLAARRRWQGKLAVYLGLELDYIKGLQSAVDSDIRALNLDYIIGAVHYVVPQNGAKPFTVDDPPDEFEKGLREGFGGDMEALSRSYWDAMTEMINLGGFDILAHADLARINIRENDFRRHAEIANAAARAGLTVEVNTGGLNRGRLPDTCPSLSFLRVFREHGVPAIITADAHCTADLDGHYDTALQTLLEAGYTEHVLFEGKENAKALWRREKLA
jgi:histidinol-phosphatase (PHP family)